MKAIWNTNEGPVRCLRTFKLIYKIVNRRDTRLRKDQKLVIIIIRRQKSRLYEASGTPRSCRCSGGYRRYKCRSEDTNAEWNETNLNNNAHKHLIKTNPHQDEQTCKRQRQRHRQTQRYTDADTATDTDADTDTDSETVERSHWVARTWLKCDNTLIKYFVTHQHEQANSGASTATAAKQTSPLAPGPQWDQTERHRTPWWALKMPHNIGAFDVEALLLFTLTLFRAWTILMGFRVEQMSHTTRVKTPDHMHDWGQTKTLSQFTCVRVCVRLETAHTHTHAL